MVLSLLGEKVRGNESSIIRVKHVFIVTAFRSTELSKHDDHMETQHVSHLLTCKSCDLSLAVEMVQITRGHRVCVQRSMLNGIF